MKTHWYLLDINPRGVFAALVAPHDAALLLDRGFQLILADGLELNALAHRHRRPLHVRELGGPIISARSSTLAAVA